MSHPRGHPRAFTLIELIVVMVIISIVAAVIAPRLRRDAWRDAERAARGVRNLLSIAASRDSLGSERLVIEIDRESSTIALLSNRLASDGTHAARVDPLTPPMNFAPLTLRSAAVDGRVLEAATPRIEFPEYEPRGVIEVSMELAGTGGAWHVVLLPGATQAEVSNGGSLDAMLRPVDLDAQGGGESPW